MLRMMDGKASIFLGPFWLLGFPLWPLNDNLIALFEPPESLRLHQLLPCPARLIPCASIQNPLHIDIEIRAAYSLERMSPDPVDSQVHHSPHVGIDSIPNLPEHNPVILDQRSQRAIDSV